MGKYDVTWTCAGTCSSSRQFGRPGGDRFICDICGNLMTYPGDPEAAKYRALAKERNAAADKRRAAFQAAKLEATGATGDDDAPVFPGKDWAVWHLTRGGWVAGSSGLRDGHVTKRKRPTDRALTVRSMTFSDGRDPATVVAELWRHPSEEARKLIETYGDSPAGAVWPAYKPFPTPPEST